MPHSNDLDDPSNWQIYSPEQEDGRADWPSRIYWAAVAIAGLAFIVFVIWLLGIR